MHTRPGVNSTNRTISALLAAVCLTIAACSGDGQVGSTNVAGEIPSDSPLAKYLSGIANEVAGIEISLRLYHIDIAYSLALPDGSIAVSWGMLNVIGNEAQFACMIGHEIAHLRLGHVSGSGDIEPDMLLDRDALVRLSSHEADFGREVAADRAGLDLCAAAGYETIALPNLLYQLDTYGDSVNDLTDGARVGLSGDARGRIDAALSHSRGLGYAGGRAGSAEYVSAIVAHQKLAQGERSDQTFPSAEGDGFFDVLETVANCAAFIDDTWDGNAFGIEFSERDTTPNVIEMVDATNEWIASQCAAKTPQPLTDADGNVRRDDSGQPITSTVVPTNQIDAYGHCWIGCRGTQLAGATCAHLSGWMREKMRDFEDFTGGDLHDSFYQDNVNQFIGRALAANNPGASCSDMCSGAYTSLDFSAPQRQLYDCATDDYVPNQLGIGAECGSTAIGEYRVENDTSRDFFIKAATDSDRVNAQPSDPLRVAAGAAANVDVTSSCDCACNSDDNKRAKLTVTIQPSGSGSIEFREANVTVACRRKPAQCGSTAGDPHLRTFDAMLYDYHAVGEFVLARTDDADFEVQVRQKKYSNDIAINSAVAMNVAGARVSYYAVDSGGLTGLYVDGTELPAPTSRYWLESGGYIDPRSEGGYVVTWPVSGAQVWFTAGPGVNVVVGVAEGSVAGLLGNGNGGLNDDLQTPDGLPFEYDDFDRLYGDYRDNSRVTAETTLFDYAPGTSTESFWDPNYPTRLVTVDSLSAEQRAFGIEVCTQAGVPVTWFDDCVFDVGLTGDPVFADAGGLAFDVGAQIDPPGVTAAGSAVQLSWRGPDGPNDVLAITATDAAAGVYLDWNYSSEGDPLTLTAPDFPGNYEVRYIQARSGSVLASASLQVAPVDARVSIPDTAAAGSEFEVNWQGPGNPDDRIDIAAVGSNTTLNWKYASSGNPVIIRAPDVPGSYQVRYLQGRSGAALTSQSITVTAVTARLQAPGSVPAGSQFEISWDGPDNPFDRIDIAAIGSNTSLTWTYVDSSNPVMLQAPDSPGRYQVRYLNGQSGTALTSITIEIQ